MGKDRTCKVCAVYVPSVDKYMKYQGMCGKCWNLSRLPTFLAYKCYVCKINKTNMKLGLFNTIVCTDCQYNYSFYCQDQNRHNNCLLTSKCCLCRDKRTIKKEGTYDGYIDGIGHVTMKNRWDFYCANCCKAQLLNSTDSSTTGSIIVHNDHLHPPSPSSPC